MSNQRIIRQPVRIIPQTSSQTISQAIHRANTQANSLAKSFAFTVAITLATIIASAIGSSEAQAQPVHSETKSRPALMDLSLTELLDLRLASRPLVGLHHVHPAGEWMVSINHHQMDMRGLQDGRNTLSPQRVFDQGFRVTPVDMHGEMTMLDVMYGLSDRVTVMAMLPHIRRSMNHRTAAGGQFQTQSAGAGDLSVSAIWSAFESGSRSLYLTLGLGLPTGSIDETDAAPMGANQPLPYPMQLGSGSMAPQLGITYIHAGELWTLGAHGSERVHANRNSADYRLGNLTRLDLWASRQWNDWLTTSIRAHAQNRRNIIGADARLNPNMVPTADPTRQGAQQVDLALSASIRLPFEWSQNLRVIAQVSRPVYQSLDGPQLAIDQRWATGIQWIF